MTNLDGPCPKKTVFVGGIFRPHFGVTRAGMRIRGHLAVVLASVVTALSVFSGVCDLRCASAQGPGSDARKSSAGETAGGAEIGRAHV